MIYRQRLVRIHCTWLVVPLVAGSIMVISFSDLVGVDFKLKLMSLKGKKLKLTIWDTGACHFVFTSDNCLSMYADQFCAFSPLVVFFGVLFFNHEIVSKMLHPVFIH
jgi:hypothetical protein